MALHEQSIGATDEWYTPPYVFRALGDLLFDMDVASPGWQVTPWILAKEFITRGSLERDWKGFVWMNPPFGARNGLEPWLSKFVNHADGIALVPDRTSAPWWQKHVPKMQSVLFVRRKIKFIDSAGRSGMSPAQGTCLLALGPNAHCALIHAAQVGFGLLMAPL